MAFSSSLHIVKFVISSSPSVIILYHSIQFLPVSLLSNHMMAPRLVFFLFLTIANAVTAFERAGMITPTLNERAVSLPGGWGANQYNSTCPAGSTGCFIGGCCPNALSCLGTGDPVNVICCPESKPMIIS